MIITYKCTCSCCFKKGFSLFDAGDSEQVVAASWRDFQSSKVLLLSTYAYDRFVESEAVFWLASSLCIVSIPFFCMFQEMYHSILVIPRILWEGNVLTLYRWRTYPMFKSALVNCIYACYMWMQSHRMRGHFISKGIQGWTLFQCRRFHNICLDMKEVLKHLWTHLRCNVYCNSRSYRVSTSPAITTIVSFILCKRS